ncbi:18051_t:CDS:2, partial [Funneliformis geosporum]
IIKMYKKKSDSQEIKQTNAALQCFKQAKEALKNNDLLKARELFTRAINLKSNYIPFYDCRASTYEKLGQLEAALQDALSMIKLDKTSVKAYLRAGKVYRLLNQTSNAIKIYNVGLSLVITKDQYYELLQKQSEDLQNKLRNKLRQSDSSNTYDMMCILPPELKDDILKRLPFTNLCKASAVSKTWRKYILSSEILWHNLDFERPFFNTLNDNIIRVYVKRGGRRVKKLICGDSPKLTDKTLKILREAQCDRLQYIAISNSNVTDEGIRAFIKTVGLDLKTIEFSKSDITNMTLSVILSKCKQLESLNLSFCESLTSEAFNPALVDNKALKLKNINLQCHGQIKGNVIDYLSLLFPNLVHLDLAGISGLTTKSIVSLTSFKDLKFLQITGDLPVEGTLSLEDAFEVFIGICTQLNSFSLKECQSLTDKCIRKLVQSCDDLKELDFTSSIYLTDETMCLIGNYCEQLKVLRIGKSPGITDVGVIKVMKSGCGSLLEVIDLQSNSNITDKTLEVMGSHAKCLREVNFKWCKNVTGSGVGPLVRQCGNTLKHLILQECYNVAPDAIELARKILGKNGGLVSYEFRGRF